MNFLKILVLASFAVCLLFTVVTVVLSCLGIMLPDTLIQYFFTVFGGELGATALIRIVKYTIDNTTISDRIKRKKENEMPLESADFKASSSTGYYDEEYTDGGNVYG